jgi:hypothetical protein
VYAKLLEDGHKVRQDGNEAQRLIKSAAVVTTRVGSGAGSYSLWMLSETLEGDGTEAIGTQGQKDIRTRGQEGNTVVFRDSVSSQSSLSSAV